VAACGGTPPLRPDDGVFAGFLRHPDHQAGRLIAFPWRLGELDNTLITVMSGNGAEGRVSDETETEEWS
jgi:arylsulfatase A-like enzyme